MKEQNKLNLADFGSTEMLRAVGNEVLVGLNGSDDRLRLSILAAETKLDHVLGQSVLPPKPKYGSDFKTWQDYKQSERFTTALIVTMQFELAGYQFRNDPQAYVRFLRDVEPILDQELFDFFTDFGREHLGVDEEVG